MKQIAWTLLLSACFIKPPQPAGSDDAGLSDDAARDAGADADAGFSTTANYMFVTKNRFNGNSLSAPGAVDAICRNAAIAAQLPEPQSFVAWFSLLSQSRDALALLAGSTGWLRPDGYPFAFTPADIAAGLLLYPPRLDPSGNEAFVDQELVATGTGADGLGAVQCDPGGGGSITIGLNDASSPLWTSLYDVDCSNNFKLYCFGTGRQDDVRPTVPSGALRAFLSTPTVASLDDLDTRCVTDASAAGLTGVFKALVATTTQAPRDRISNPNNKAWYRLDGVRIAGPALQAFDAPLDVDAMGFHRDGGVWFGGLSPDATTNSANCSDWVGDGSGSTSLGQSIRSSSSAFSGLGTFPCSTSQRVYCFELELEL